MKIKTDVFEFLGVNTTRGRDSFLVKTCENYKLYQSICNETVNYVEIKNSKKFARIILHNNLSKKSLSMLESLVAFDDL